LALGWDEPRGQELVFDGQPLEPRKPRLAGDDDLGNEPVVAPDDNS
jgi:hypothetical protein